MIEFFVWNWCRLSLFETNVEPRLHCEHIVLPSVALCRNVLVSNWSCYLFSCSLSLLLKRCKHRQQWTLMNTLLSHILVIILKVIHEILFQAESISMNICLGTKKYHVHENWSANVTQTVGLVWTWVFSNIYTWNIRVNQSFRVNIAQ